LGIPDTGCWVEFYGLGVGPHPRPLSKGEGKTWFYFRGNTVAEPDSVFYFVAMAKVCGPIKFTGCIDNTCFYKMGGEYYVRMKSSLSGKRVKKDPVFTLTMVYADLLARASKLASVIYKEFPDELKGKGMFKKLVGEVMHLLKAGRPEEEIRFVLSPMAGVEEEEEICIKDAVVFADIVLEIVFGGRKVGTEELIMESG
jgi:hypothetical protein